MTDTELDVDTVDDATAKVFLSYSRKDRERAQSIADVLRERHFGVFKDTDDILPTEEWKGRLEQLITEADTVVFLLSPHSLASEVCRWEVEHAKRLHKRIAPIVISEVDTAEIPPDLARLNFIFCTERDRFQDAVDNLVSALGTDIEWIREHTRLAELAMRWERAGSPARLLLRGQDIADAEYWRDGRPDDAPQITTPQARFVGASRAGATRRQRIALVSSAVAVVVALSLAGFAYLQRQAAIQNAQIAEENEIRAIAEQNRAERERDAAQVNQSLLLTGFADRDLKRWGPVEATLLALEAMPDARSADSVARDRPLVDEALVMLRNARTDILEREILLTDLKDARFTLSPDDRHFVVHDPSENTVHIVDLSGERPARRFVDKRLRGTAKILSFSPDGAHVAVPATRGSIFIVPVLDQGPARHLQVPGWGDNYWNDNWISDALFIRNGRELLTRDNSGIVRAIDLATEAVNFQTAADAIAVNPDSIGFATTKDSVIRIFDANAKPGAVAVNDDRKDRSPPFDQIRYSPDGRWIAAGTEIGTTVFRADTAEGHGNTPDRDQSIFDFGFAPSGDWHFVSGADALTAIYNLTDKSVVAGFRGQRGWIMDVDISADQKVVLSASSEGNAQIWSPGDTRAKAFLMGHFDMVIQAALIDGDRGALTLSEDGTVRRWNFSKWRETAKDQAKSLVEGYAGDPVFASDRSIMALSEAGVFRVETGEPVVISATPGFTPKFEQMSADGTQLLALMRPDGGSEFTDICIYDLTDAANLRCLFERDHGAIKNAAIDPEGTLLTYHEVVETDRHFVSFDLNEWQEMGRHVEGYLTRLEHPRPTADGSGVLLHTRGNNFALMDRALSKTIATFGSDNGDGFYMVSDDFRYSLQTWGAENIAEIWDLAAQKRISRFEAKIRADGQNVFSPSGAYLAARISQSEIAVIEVATGAVMATLDIRSVDHSWISAPLFSNDETILVANSGPNVAVLDIASGRKVYQVEVDFQGLAPLPFGKWLADDKSELVVWTWAGPTRYPLLLDPQAVVVAAQNDVTRCLSRHQRKLYFLPTTPPRWCITGPGLENEADPAKWRPKYPFHSPEWRDWLIAVDRGDDPLLPSN